MHSRIFFLGLLTAGSSALDQPKQPAHRMLRAQVAPLVAPAAAGVMANALASATVMASAPIVIGAAAAAATVAAVPIALGRKRRKRRKALNNADQNYNQDVEALYAEYHKNHGTDYLDEE